MIINNTKKTILYVITSLDVGGAEKTILKTIPKLNNYNNIICSLSSNGEIGVALQNLGYKVYCLQTGKYFSLSSIIRFYKIVNKEKPDVLISYLIHADIFGRIFGRIFGIKKIICSLRSELNDNKYNKLFVLEKFTSCLVNKYIALTSSIKIKYSEKSKININKIVVIPNGLDLVKYNNINDKIFIKQNLQIKNELVVISCIAKLRPEKNHILLLDIFKKISENNKNIVLLLVGDGPEEHNIKKYINKNNLQDKVILLGNRNDIIEILSITDVFILLSKYEGMSNAILEAMASGCTIVASDISANKEILRDTENGFLVNLEDKNDILKKLNLALDPIIQNKFKETCLKDIQDYSIDEVTKKLENEIQKIIDK